MRRNVKLGGASMTSELEDLPLPDGLPVIPDSWRYELLGMATS